MGKDCFGGEHASNEDRVEEMSEVLDKSDDKLIIEDEGVMYDDDVKVFG